MPYWQAFRFEPWNGTEVGEMDDHDICVEAAKVYIRQAVGNVYVYVKGDNGITSCYSIVGDVRVCRGTVNVTSRIDLIEHGTAFPGDE